MNSMLYQDLCEKAHVRTLSRGLEIAMNIREKVIEFLEVLKNNVHGLDLPLGMGSGFGIMLPGRVSVAEEWSYNVVG
jgi:hypothetical protein